MSWSQPWIVPLRWSSRLPDVSHFKKKASPLLPQLRGARYVHSPFVCHGPNSNCLSPSVREDYCVVAPGFRARSRPGRVKRSLRKIGRGELAGTSNFPPLHRFAVVNLPITFLAAFCVSCAPRGQTDNPSRPAKHCQNRHRRYGADGAESSLSHFLDLSAPTRLCREIPAASATRAVQRPLSPKSTPEAADKGVQGFLFVVICLFSNLSVSTVDITELKTGYRYRCYYGTMFLRFANYLILMSNTYVELNRIRL